MRRRAAVTTVLGLILGLSTFTTSSGASPRPASAPLGSSIGDLQAIDDPQLRDEIERRRFESGSSADSAMITVELLHAPQNAAAVDALVGQVGGRSAGNGPSTLTEASVPIDELGALASAESIIYVRSPRSMSLRPATEEFTAAGPRTTEALGVMNLDDWHSAGYLGAGVRIGIIDYFDEAVWAGQQTLGEVPAPAGMFCLAEGSGCSIWNPETGGHGNAVSEIVHDLAPASGLYLATVDTVSDYYAAIDWFVANGVTIINRSLGTPYDGPGDGSGAMDQVVDYATARGITWFNAAGNEGYQQYWRGAWVDDDNDGWLEFGFADETLDISSACFSLLGTRWSDWGPPGTRTDYDFFIFEDGFQVYPETAPSQQQGAPPIELDGISGCGSGGQKSVKVFKRSNGSGTTGDVLEVLSYAGQLQYSSAAYAASTPVVDSRNRALVAVGAIDAPTGVTPAQLAYYSSNGPTNDGRRKPDVSAPTCFASSVFAPQCFNGTSAATPAVAAAAAVLRSAGAASTPQGLAALVKHSVIDAGAPGPDNQFGTGEVRLPTPPVGAVDGSPAVFTAVTPARVLDTRSPGTGYLGVQDAETILDVQIAGVGPVPAGATAVALNLTIVDAATGGYAQAFPSRWAPVDGVSTLNIESRAQTLPNFAIAPIGEAGMVSLYLPSGGHVLIDVLGYFRPSEATAAGRLVPLDPRRVLDTRQKVAARPSVLPNGWVDHRPVANEVVTVDFKAASGLPASGAAAVVLTVTATDASANGFVTAFPSGIAVPNASVLNLRTGSTAANTVIVPLGSDGRISLFTTSSLDLIVDLQGYITDASAPVSAAGRFVPVSPIRSFDSRSGSPIDGATVPLATGGPLPATGVAAVSLNVTAAPGLQANGYLQLWPSTGTVSGEFSNLNWNRAGQVVASGGIVRLGATGALSAAALGPMHLILDINGYFTG